MDPLSVGLFIIGAIVIVFLFFDVRYLKKQVAAQRESLPGLIAELRAEIPEKRIAALEIENRVIRADIDEIKSRRKAEPGQPLRPGSFRAFKNQMQGAEVDPK